MNARFLEDGNGEFDVRKISCLIVIIAMLLLIGIFLASPIISQFEGLNKWDDVGNYYKQYLHMANGEIPYKDFVFEYPPLAIPFIFIPGLFSFGSEDLYGIAFTFLSAGATVLCYWFLVKTGKNLGLNNRIITLLLVLCTLLLTRCFFRLEMFLMVFVILGFYFYSKKEYILAFSMMSLGTMLKLIPAIFALIMLLPFLLRKDFKSFAVYTLFCGTVCLIITLPFLIIDSGSAFAYLTYHSDRGLQLESVAASVVLFFNMFTPIATSVMNYGSTNLAGDIPDAVASVMTYVMVGAMVAYVIISAIKYRSVLVSEDNTKMVIFIGLISLMLFIALNKVFSAQYILWVIPLIPLLLADRNNQGVRKDVLYLTVICLFLTILETYPLYPILYEDFNPIAVLVLLARNIVFCVMIAKLIKLTDNYFATVCTSRKNNTDA